MKYFKTLLKNQIVPDDGPAYQGSKCSWIMDKGAHYYTASQTDEDNYLTLLPELELAFVNVFDLNAQGDIMIQATKFLNSRNAVLTEAKLYTRIFYDRDNGIIKATQTDVIFKENGVQTGIVIPELYIGNPGSNYATYDMEIDIPIAVNEVGRTILLPLFCFDSGFHKFAYMSVQQEVSNYDDEPDRIFIYIVADPSDAGIDSADIDDYMYDRIVMSPETYENLSKWSEKGPYIPSGGNGAGDYVSL